MLSGNTVSRLSLCGLFLAVALSTGRAQTGERTTDVASFRSKSKAFSIGPKVDTGPPATRNAKCAASDEPSETAAEEGRIAFLGEVVQTGAFLYQPAMLKDALKAVGGFTQKAEKAKILVYRGGLSNPSRARCITYNYDRVLIGKAPDLALEPGDVVLVPVHHSHTVLGDVGSFFGHAFGDVGSFLGKILPSLVPFGGTLVGLLDPHRTPTASQDPSGGTTRAANLEEILRREASKRLTDQLHRTVQGKR